MPGRSGKPQRSAENINAEHGAENRNAPAAIAAAASQTDKKGFGALLGSGGAFAHEQGLIRVATEMKMYHGSLPPAEEMRIHEAVCPGAANRIIAMAEDTVCCNNHCKEKIVRHNIKFENLGLAAGFTALLAAFSAALYMALQGHDAVAGAFLGLAVTGIIGKFIPARTTKQKEKK